jgi:hypothetical protein
VVREIASWQIDGFLKKTFYWGVQFNQTKKWFDFLMLD